MINETIYKNLIRIAPEILEPSFEYRKLEASGFMDLHIDLLMRDPSRITIALAHNYKHPSGDTIPDPDMEIAVYPDRKVAEALSYQDTYGYQVAGENTNLNGFLNQWLKNIIDQGHR